MVRPARYGLRGDTRLAALFAQWHDMEGFFVGRESAFDAHENPAEEPATVRVSLHGVEWLDAATDRPTRTLDLGDAALEVLDGAGHVLGDYSLWDTALTVPGGPSEATLTARLGALPHAGGAAVWDRWRAARPTQPNGWAQVPIGEREAWLEVARIVAFRDNRTPYRALSDQHELDGRHIDDLASFFCAVGEALAGPGGTCGSSFADLADYLRHAPRSTPRSRLVWRDMPVAAKGLARTFDGVGYLDLALTVLAEGNFDVVPA
jgi:hypothetical protein